MQTITLGLEEEEVLRSSVLMDICNDTELTLYRLERALELHSIDRQHAIAMRNSNLFGRLVARYEQNNEPESRCLVLRCLSEAMENMCRNEVYELAKIIADAQLGPWCVGELMLSIERDQFICSELLKFASHLVKVCKHDRDYVISRFILPQFPWLFQNHRDAILFLIKNATLHESHSADMLDLFETVLSAVMAHCVELSERRFNYHLVVNIVNNYVFDRCENIDRCIRFGFDGWVWGSILTTRQITNSDIEFLTSYIKHAAELPDNLCDKFRGLCDIMNDENCVEILILLLEYGQRCQAEHNNRWFQMFHHALRVSIAYMPSMAFNRKMVLSELTIGWLV